MSEWTYGKPETFWRDHLGLLKGRWFFSLFILGFVAFVGIIACAAIALDRRSCAITGDEMRVETHYRTFASGCYVELPDGASIPLDHYRAIQEVQP